MKSGKALIVAHDVHGYRWVPGSPHRLVVAGWGIYGTGMLAMWDGGTEWRHLVRSGNPDREGFTLYGVSRDGRFITYAHKRNAFSQEPERQHRLRLPGAPRKTGAVRQR